MSQGLNVKYSRKISKDYVWSDCTVKRILQDVVYIGHLAQSRTTTPSYKNKKVIVLPKDQWIVCKNTHEPIIDMDTWNKAVSIRENRARACKEHGEKHKYSGVVKCYCCEGNFKKGFYAGAQNKKVDYFKCTEACKPYSECGNKKVIRVDDLDEILIDSINNRIKKYKDLSVMNKINIKEILGNDNSSQLKALIIEKNDIEKKINLKDSVSQGMYEDLKTGIIDYEEYKTFKENFKTEKNNLITRLEVVNKQIKEIEDAEFNFEEAGRVFKKYTSVKEITREILNEFVDKIIVGEINPETELRDVKIKWKYQF